MVKKYWQNALSKRAARLGRTSYTWGAMRFGRAEIASIILSLGMLLALGSDGRAESPETIPNELKETISEIEEAANEQDLSKLMNYYNANFTHSDGLTFDLMTQALEKTWSTYPQLKYRTTIKSWERKGDNLVVETVTRMNGAQKDQGRNIRLVSTVRSRQFFQDEQIVRQEIISEQTELKTGSQPPAIRAIAPEIVKVGEKYNFDVIVTEPLKNNVLLGAALEERTGGDRYINPSTLELEPLSAGGIYKVVTAPLLPDNHWLSAIVVRSDGITMVTKRVRIER
ncbi:MAG: nuclear transport factor 2 family protein [Xenococcus sp. MO_188.B8]|nr:nuclear transport factor 2 family protein [Xenococcus sp. MO_188.B8]